MPQKPDKEITIAYVKLKKDRFISTTINVKNFLGMLSKFANVVKVSTNSKRYDLRRLQRFNADYLLIGTQGFGASQFVLRERHNINISFIVVLRTIQPWYNYWLQIVPLIRKEDIVIAPSEYAKESFLRIADRQKVWVIPNCLDVEKIQKEILPAPERRKKVISFMGRLSREKGIEILIESLPEIISRAGDVDLNIIGPLCGGKLGNYPKSGYVKELEKKVRGLGLTARVRFKGLRLGLDKYRILSQSDLFINPTIWIADNIPFSSIEALVCGLPVITTDLGGNKELVKDGENGYLVGVTFDSKNRARIDRKRLIDSAVKLLQDGELALQMREKVYERALDYDFRKVMPGLISLLKKNKEAKRACDSRWEALKDKTVCDFRSLYSKQMRFFINYERSACRSYLSVYNEMKARNGRRKKGMSAGQRGRNIRQEPRTAQERLAKKIKMDFIRYLCLGLEEMKVKG